MATDCFVMKPLQECHVLVTPTSYGQHDAGLRTELEALVARVTYNETGKPMSSAQLAGLLPGVDGFEVCYRLRARATSESPMPIVLMLTAKSQESDRTMSKHVGADAYLAKPATPQELLNMVEALLAERQAA